MSTATTNTDGKWSIPISHGTVTSTTADSTKTLTLSTAGTYLDKDIVVTSTASKLTAAALSASGTGSATISSVSVGTKSNSKYPLTGSATISGTASASTTTSGYATKGSTTGTGSVSGTASLSYDMTAASASISLSPTVDKPTISISASNDNILASAATTDSSAKGTYYAAVTATVADKTISATNPSSITAGYLGATSEVSASGTVKGATSSTYYIPITAGSLSASAYNSTSQTDNDLSGYTEQTITVPSQGSLVLSEGYYPKTFVTLDAMLDGKTDTAGTAAKDIKNGFIAYDVDGNKLTGTLPQLTSSNFTRDYTSLGGSTGATFSGPTYNSSNDNFDISSSGSASKTISVTASKEGWVASGATAFSGSISSGTVSGATTLAKVALTAEKSSGSLTLAPTLARTAKPTDDTWVDAASGAATTTKPTSGPYIQIDAAANTNTLKVKPKVGTAGYGTTSYYGYTEYSATVGAAKATTRYVPITTTSASAKTAPTASATGGGVTLGTVTTTKPTSGYYIQADATTGVTQVTEAGWISTGTTNTGAATTRYYPLNSATLTHENTATETPATAALKSTASTVTSAASGSYYITIGKDSTNSSAGSVVHSASVSEGYVNSDGLSANATIATSANVSAKTFYFASTTATNTVAAELSGATSGYSEPTVVSASTTVPQLKMTGDSSATTGSVYAGDNGEACKYINYYTGTYTLA